MSNICPTAIRLLETYKKGIVDQMQLIAKHDHRDSVKTAPSIIAQNVIDKKPTDWELAKEKLNEVQKEINFLSEDTWELEM